MNFYILTTSDNKKTLVIFGVLYCFLSLLACKSGYLKIDNEQKLEMNDEFQNAVKISSTQSTPAVNSSTTNNSTTEKSTVTPAPSSGQNAQIVESKKSNVIKNIDKPKSGKEQIVSAPKSAKETKKLETVKIEKTKKDKLAIKDQKATKDVKSDDPNLVKAARQPDLEDSVGFNGRRPIVDPFRVGERVTHNVHYFKVSAGELALAVEPFVEVNGRKSYSFITEIKSSSMFSSFYSVDDRVVALVDFETLVPFAFTLSVKESGQLREGRSAFDFTKMQATYWEKKYTKKSGLEEKKQQWEILPFSQSVFTAIFYMRNFTWEVGKEYAFRVADDEENLVFKAKALRKEKLETEIGDFPTIVVKPEIMVKGAFKPVGDILIWLSDDDRKYVLRIESNIKIGTLISEVIKLEPGQ